MTTIKSYKTVICHYVETDDPDWSSYRRSGSECWEVLMGESWEPVYDCDDLERQFQTMKKLTESRWNEQSGEY